LDASKKASELNPDLIILDESKPRMDGLHAARVLHSADTEVLFILFTLHADTISALEASAAGIVLDVSKMQGMSVLAEQVGSLLRRGNSEVWRVHSPE